MNMNTINNNALPTINQMMMERKERFSASDADGNGQVSKEEFINNAPENVSAEKLEKMFARMDTDGNGEISDEEHQLMLDQMVERMSNASPETQTSYGNLTTLESLFDDMENSEQDAEFPSFVETMKQQLQAIDGDDSIDKAEFSQSMLEFIRNYPRIDTSV